VMGNAMPPQLNVPAKVSARTGEDIDIRCIATAPEGEQLSYIWYETHTGELQDIRAISIEPEFSDFWICDTGSSGTRYYVCGVQTSAGGMAYSSVIPVTVTGRPFEPQLPAATVKNITEIAVTDIDAPETGKSPDYAATIGGTGYSFQKTNTESSLNGISWYDITAGGFIPVNGKFSAGHEYQVYVELTADAGFQFQTPDGTINQSMAEVFGSSNEVLALLIFSPCKTIESSVSEKPVTSSPVTPIISQGAGKETASSASSQISSAASSQMPPAISKPTDNAASSVVSSAASESVTNASSSVSPQTSAPEAQQSSAISDNSSSHHTFKAEEHVGIPWWGFLLGIVISAMAGTIVTLIIVRKK